MTKTYHLPERGKDDFTTLAVQLRLDQFPYVDISQQESWEQTLKRLPLLAELERRGVKEV